jgi:hypothetical protein
VWHRVRALDAPADGVAAVDEVGDGVRLEQLAPGLERLGAGGLRERIRLDEREKVLDLGHGMVWNEAGTGAGAGTGTAPPSAAGGVDLGRASRLAMRFVGDIART